MYDEFLVPIEFFTQFSFHSPKSKKEIYLVIANGTIFRTGTAANGRVFFPNLLRSSPVQMVDRWLNVTAHRCNGMKNSAGATLDQSAVRWIMTIYNIDCLKQVSNLTNSIFLPFLLAFVSTTSISIYEHWTLLQNDNRNESRLLICTLPIKFIHTSIALKLHWNNINVSIFFVNTDDRTRWQSTNVYCTQHIYLLAIDSS